MASRNRGKPKPSLRKLSREKPSSEDVKVILRLLDEGPPIVAAVLGAALLDKEIEEMIRGRLPRDDDETMELLTSRDGPLANFSQKIALGYALKLYPAETLNNLNIVRSIRNLFAHASKVIQFDHPLILKELASAETSKGPRSRHHKHLMLVKEGHPNPQRAFALLCTMISNELKMREIRILKLKSSRLEKQHAQLQDGFLPYRRGRPSEIVNYLAGLRSDLASGPKR